MLAHAFAWSKTIKNAIKLSKKIFFHHAYERLMKGLHAQACVRWWKFTTNLTSHQNFPGSFPHLSFPCPSIQNTSRCCGVSSGRWSLCLGTGSWSIQSRHWEKITSGWRMEQTVTPLPLYPERIKNYTFVSFINSRFSRNRQLGGHVQPFRLGVPPRYKANKL